MGNCPSRFRAQLDLNHDLDSNGTSDIVMKPVEDGQSENGKNDMSTDKTDKVDATNGHSTKTAAADDSPKTQPLIVEQLNLCIEENSQNHRTNCFYSSQGQKPRLVCRRGAPIQLKLHLTRSYKEEQDILCLVFSTKDAKNPNYSQGTQIILPITKLEDSQKNWHISSVECDENSVTIQVVPAVDCIVGEWTLEVDTTLKDDTDSPDFHYKVENPIYILFNPWCPDDTVYLEGEDLRKEYVLSDSGLIWRGTHNCLRPCIWNYAQFEENIVEASLFLLTNVGKLSLVKRADPVRVVRHISAVLNAHDNKGVLMGNYSGKYKGGQQPTSWCGSQKILQTFLKTKKSVKYGQCWVFAGVFTTVCRALGIPSRPVTNFSSGHDNNNSLTVDLYIDSEGKLVDNLTVDSVWNFHAWTEVWMERPDLEPGSYGGWQVVDATPQEMSDGIFQCGPASVAAIKRGEVMKSFDTQFLYSEVNAAKVYWKYYGARQPLKLMQTSDCTGYSISTKAVGKFEREDITSNYKSGERICKDQEDLLKTLKHGSNSRYRINDEFDDIKFELALVDDIIIGETFTVKFTATSKNTEALEYSVRVTMRVDTVSYTGKITKMVKKDEFVVQLGPGNENAMTIKVEYAEYERALVEQCAFVITCTAHVVEKEYDFCVQEVFRVRMPDVSVQVDGDIVKNQPVDVTAFFTNPLPKPLRGGAFIIEGTGFGAPLTLKCKGDVKAGADARVVCKMTPKCTGSKVITAKFHSKDLTDVDGYHEVLIKPAPVVEKDEKEGNSHL